jgi:hypothetical protein
MKKIAEDQLESNLEYRFGYLAPQATPGPVSRRIGEQTL